MVMHAVISANVSLSAATERRLKLPRDDDFWSAFETEAEKQIRSLPDEAVVLDLGGGRRCRYAHAVEPLGRVRLIAVDIDPGELALNTDVAQTCVANVAERLPMPDGSADLVLSRALLEHVDGVPAAVREMARVLRPGAATLHFVPCRYSVFGMGARLLPFGPLVWLVHKIAPWTRDSVRFPVHYDHCFPQALEQTFRTAGFADVQVQVTWSCGRYFFGVYPLYLCYALYEQVVRRLGVRRLAAYAIVKAVR